MEFKNPQNLESKKKRYLQTINSKTQIGRFIVKHSENENENENDYKHSRNHFYAENCGFHQ